MNIQRYWIDSADGVADVVRTPHPSGAWVKWADVRDEIEQLRSRLDSAPPPSKVHINPDLYKAWYQAESTKDTAKKVAGCTESHDGLHTGIRMPHGTVECVDCGKPLPTTAMRCDL